MRDSYREHSTTMLGNQASCGPWTDLKVSGLWFVNVTWGSLAGLRVGFRSHLELDVSTQQAFSADTAYERRV